MFQLHTLGDVNEGAARESRAVEGGVFAVPRRNHLAKPGTEDVFILRQTLRRIHENDTLLAQFLAHAGIGGLGIVLGIDTSQKFTLLFRDAEALESPLHIVGHFIPASLGFRAVGKIIAYLVEIEFLKLVGGPVRRQGFAFKDLQRLQPELADPVRFPFDIGNVIDHIARQAETIEFVAFREVEISLVPVDVLQNSVVRNG